MFVIHWVKFKFISILNQILSFCLLGFTFSFPCKQEGLASARLTSWTKGFTCSGVVNEDVVKMLQTAIDEKVLILNKIKKRRRKFFLLILEYQCTMCCSC